jgi:predicted ester cyclase
MNEQARNKEVVRDFIQAVWIDGDLAALAGFWTEDCVNHASTAKDKHGLEELRIYHELFLTAFSAFSNVRMEILQQLAEGDRVVTHIFTQADHTAPFFGIPPSGKHVSTSVIRIDLIKNGRIAEHWSVSDAAALTQQLQ